MIKRLALVVPLILALLVTTTATSASAAPVPQAVAAASAPAAVPVAARTVLHTDDPSTDDNGDGFFSLKDSHGIPVSSFNLDLATGPHMWDNARVDRGVYMILMNLLWEVYLWGMSCVIWFLGWGLSMSWLQALMTPVNNFAVTVQSWVDQIGIAGICMVALAAVVAYWFLKGRIAGGISELMIGVVIAALATGALAHPVATITGPSGILYQARDDGLTLAASIATNGDVQTADPKTMTAQMTSGLVDTLIRQPHQIINYGQVIDGTKCEDAYNKAVGKEDARKKLGKCNGDYQDYANSPSAQKVMNVLFLLPTATFFELFSLGLLLIYLLACLGAGWSGIQLIYKLPIGVISGGARGSLFKTFGNVAFCALMVGVTTIFCVAWMKLQTVVLSTAQFPLDGKLAEADAATGNRMSANIFMTRIVVFDILLLVGLGVLLTMRHRIKKAMHNMAAKLAALGPRPSAVPAPMALPVGAVAHQATRALVMRRAMGPGGKSVPTSRSTAPLPQTAGPRGPIDIGPITASPRHARAGAGAGAGGTGRLALGGGPDRPLLGPGGSAPAMPGGPGPKPSLPPGAARRELSGQRLRLRLGSAAKAGVHVGAMFLTGGSSAAVTGAKAVTAAKHVSTASRTIKVARAAQTTARVGSSVRSAAVRSRLQEARTPSMRPAGRSVLDTQTGARYERSTVRTAGDRVEVLTPARAASPAAPVRPVAPVRAAAPASRAPVTPSTTSAAERLRRRLDERR